MSTVQVNHPILRRAIGALGLAIITAYVLGFARHVAHAGQRIAGVAIELGADVQDLGTPELAHYINGITAAQGTCNSVTNARRMGEGVRIACDMGTHVYFLRAANNVLFVTDITDSGN